MNATINREKLREYLQNNPLMQAAKQKWSIDDTRHKLADALEILRATGASESTIAEVKRKLDEYIKISKKYGELIHDLWGIPWQMERVICRYADCDDVEIDRLPEYIKV